MCTCIYIVEMQKEGRKKQTNNKVKRHSTPKAVTFQVKNELPRVGLEPTAPYTLDRTFYHVEVAKVLHVHMYNCCSTTELPRQLSWLGPKLTSHSAPDEHEQANY